MKNNSLFKIVLLFILLIIIALPCLSLVQGTDSLDKQPIVIPRDKPMELPNTDNIVQTNEVVTGEIVVNDTITQNNPNNDQPVNNNRIYDILAIAILLIIVFYFTSRSIYKNILKNKKRKKSE